MSGASQLASDGQPSPEFYGYEPAYAALGLLLRDPWILDEQPTLTADLFPDELCREIFSLIAANRTMDGSAVGMVVIGRLKDYLAFQQLGGPRFILDLVDKAPPTPAFADVVRVLADTAARRRLFEAAGDIRSAALDMAADLATITDFAEGRISEVVRAAEPPDAHEIGAREATAALLDKMEQEAREGATRGLMTGLRCVDYRLRGLMPGHLIIIAGRPSMAKTGLARQIAKGAAARNAFHQFAFYCLEMQAEEMAARMLSEATFRANPSRAVEYRDLVGERTDQATRDRLRDLVWEIPDNLIFDDTPTMTVEFIRRRTLALKRKAPVGAIFIDYLQIMQRPQAQGRNDAAVIGSMTQALKNLAREAGCAVVLLSQINRGVESREDKRPMLSDLRESGSIEQDANSVLFPFREVYYLERAEPKEGTEEHLAWVDKVQDTRHQMDVICAKTRGGPVGSDRQQYHAQYDAISDVEGGAF